MFETIKNSSTSRHITKWLEKLSVRGKFSVIIALIILILLFGTGTFLFGMRVMSSTRSYVEGEGLWSKSEKGAANNLLRYSSSFDEADYRQFLLLMEVPLGDKAARIELEKENPDLDVVRRGFIQGGNNPEDVNDMIFLYRRFRHISYMDTAIRAWTDGDAGNEDLMRVGSEIHAIISDNRNVDSTIKQEIVDTKLKPLVSEMYGIDKNLTRIENHFSATLSEGSRRIRDILFIIIVALNIILGAIAILIALFIEKIIIQVDKTKTEFVSLASHQLRTPPTSMRWFLEMLLSEQVGTLNEKQKEYVEEVYKNNQRMIVLVNTLLNVSRIELSVLAITPKTTNIVGLVKEVLEEYALQVRAKKLNIKEIFTVDIPLMYVDPKLLRIVLQNVISNAIKYTPKEGLISVEIALKRKNETIGHRRISKDSLIITVSDTGYGIPQNQHNKILTKFFRADNVKARDTDGTGLGLYIVKSIMEHTKGDVWFESELDKGTIVYLVIPSEGMQKVEGDQELMMGFVD